MPATTGNEAYAFQSEAFIDLMLDCWDGVAYYTFYPADVSMDNYKAGKSWVELMHGAYFWNNGKPYLRHFSKVWNLFSKKIKLGHGDYKINALHYTNISDAVGATNCYGEPVAIVNNYSIFGKSKLRIKMNNLPYADGTQLTELMYKAGKGDDPNRENQIPVTVANGSISLTVDLGMYSCAGIVLTGAEPI